MKQKNFAITGVAGYIAPRHLKAIKETGNRLVAAVDPHDSVGILDSYFDGVQFFREFERFDRHVEKLRRLGEDQRVHYVSICSPNYLHDAHARFALRVGADVICEKPVVLNPWNIEPLQELEQESGKRIYTVLQLRLHPTLIDLKAKLGKEPKKTKMDIELTYITTRGPWYQASWKGQLERSGGLATNIGIHFFDLLIWLFGTVEHSEVHFANPIKTGGYLELSGARVKWFLSIDKGDLPQDCKKNNKSTHRLILLDGEKIEFSEGFTDLHTTVYKEILSGKGFGLDDALPSIVLAYDIRNAQPIGINKNLHPYLKKIG